MIAATIHLSEEASYKEEKNKMKMKAGERDKKGDGKKWNYKTKRQQRLGGNTGGLSLEAFSKLKSMPSGFNPSLISKDSIRFSFSFSFSFGFHIYQGQATLVTFIAIARFSSLVPVHTIEFM